MMDEKVDKSQWYACNTRIYVIMYYFNDSFQETQLGDYSINYVFGSGKCSSSVNLTFKIKK
jgi:hypothetical protein